MLPTKVSRKRGPKPKPELERFFGLLEEAPDGCWLWIGYVRPNGYAQFGQANRRIVYAHRWSYQEFVGPIPEGLELDHLCRVRHCVNPEHLEPVTRAENLARSPIYWGNVKAAKTHCPKGHPYDDENTYSPPGREGAHRLCRTCRRERNREAQKRRRATKGRSGVRPE